MLYCLLHCLSNNCRLCDAELILNSGLLFGVWTYVIFPQTCACRSRTIYTSLFTMIWYVIPSRSWNWVSVLKCMWADEVKWHELIRLARRVAHDPILSTTNIFKNCDFLTAPVSSRCQSSDCWYRSRWQTDIGHHRYNASIRYETLSFSVDSTSIWFPKRFRKYLRSLFHVHIRHQLSCPYHLTYFVHCLHQMI